MPRPNGKIIVGGRPWHGSLPAPVVRLEGSGALDVTFSSSIVTGAVSALAVQSDEKVLVATFPWDAQSSQPALVRLQADGQLDSSFAVPTNLTQVTALTVQANGKILAVASVGGKWELLRLQNTERWTRPSDPCR